VPHNPEKVLDRYEALDDMKLAAIMQNNPQVIEDDGDKIKK
jgi:hypothetical protein